MTLLTDDTDHAALLRGIRDEPLNHARRLVYADWLDDHADADHLHARADFIRASCPLGRTPRRSYSPMPRAGYEWIKHNWTRLVAPALAGLEYGEPGFVDMPRPEYATCWREGRVVVPSFTFGHFHFHRPGVVGSFYHHSEEFVRLRFGWGFLERASFKSWEAASAIAPRLMVFEPLCAVVCPASGELRAAKDHTAFWARQAALARDDLANPRPASLL